MPNGATPSGTQKTGFVQKRYDLKFITTGQPDYLEWEDVKVSARVRKPGSQEPIPIKQITKLEDDSDHVLQLPDKSMIPTGGEMIEFNVGMNRDALDRLKPKLTPDPQGPLYQLNLEVDADPNLKSAMSTAMGAAMQMAPAGMGGMVSGAVLGSMKVSGSSQITVEFPHPFIWHQLMNERFEYAGATPTEIDTDNENGMQVGLHLREFNPKGGGTYQPGQEKLEVEREGDDLGLLEDIVVDSRGVTLKARRVLIGKPGDVQAPENRIKLIPTWTPPPGSTKKPARNQGKINARPPEFQFKAHTVSVTIEIFHIKENETEPVLIQTIENQTLDGERVEVNCNGLPADFKGFLRWKVTKKPNRYTADVFYMGMEKPLTSKGDRVSATIDLVQQGYKTEGTPLNLSVQIPLQQQYLNIQISKNGWRTPEALSLTATEPACTDFFKALDQGGGTLTFKVSHDLKERYEGLDVPDTVLHPEVIVTGLSGLDETVTCDDQGLVTCRFGDGAGGQLLDISDRIPPLQIDSATLEPLRKLEQQAESTGNALKSFESRAITVMKEGQKDLREAYLKDYILLPGTEKEGTPNITSTAEARKAAILSLSLMIDACGDTPELYKRWQDSYAFAFRSAVSCVFSALIDCALFALSAFKSKDMIKCALTGQKVAAEAGEEAAERAAAEGLDEAADETLEETTEQGARAGAQTAGEGAEDLSTLGPKELEERLAKNEAEREATERAVRGIEETRPDLEGELATLREAAEETDQAAKGAREVFEKSKKAEQAAEFAERVADRHVEKIKTLREQLDELKALVAEGEKKLASLPKEATDPTNIAKAKKAKEALQVLKGELDEATRKYLAAGDGLKGAVDKAKTLTEEAATLPPSSTFLEKEVVPLEQAAKQERAALEAAEEIAGNLKADKDKLKALALEKKRLRGAVEDMARDSGVLTPLGTEGGKFVIDNKHYLRNVLYGTPGIGSIIFLMDYLPDLLELAARAVMYIMNLISHYLGKCDGEVTAFSKRVEGAFRKYGLNQIDVQPVYGPKQSWVVDYVPREQDRYLDRLHCAEAKTKSIKDCSQEGRDNRKTLEAQVKNNILAGLTEAFQMASAYRSPPAGTEFSLDAYARGEHQVLGGGGALRRLVGQEELSNLKGEFFHGWDPTTVVGLNTWSECVRALDWLRWIIAWCIRIFAILGAIGTITTGIGPVGFAMVFLGADFVDAFFNSLRALIAVCYDATSKAMYLQLATNFPCLAQAWIFKGMGEFSPEDIEAINSRQGLTDFHPPDASDIHTRLEMIKQGAEARNH